VAWNESGYVHKARAGIGAISDGLLHVRYLKLDKISMTGVLISSPFVKVVTGY